MKNTLFLRTFTLLMLIAVSLSITQIPAINAVAQNNIPHKLQWIYKGLLVTYLTVSFTGKQAPWQPWSQAQMPLIGGSNVWESSPTWGSAPKTSITRLYDVFIVEGFKDNGVKVRELMVDAEQGKILLNETYIVVPGDKGFDGPFWVDPRKLVGLRPGDQIVTMVYGREPRAYTVGYVGEVDISPKAKGPNSLLDLVNFSLPIPLPENTKRKIVILHTTERAGLQQDQQVGDNVGTASIRYTLVVDAETGLILYETYSKLVAGAEPDGQIAPTTSSVTIRALAEALVDLEDRLPRYHELKYDNIIHAGYTVGVTELYRSGIYDVYILSWGYEVLGAYKNRAYIVESSVLIAPQSYISSNLTVWLLDIGKRRAMVESSINMLPGVNVTPRKISEEATIPLLVEPRENKLTILGEEYVSKGTVNANMTDIQAKTHVLELRNPTRVLELARLYYDERGILIALEPTIIGVELTPARQPILVSTLNALRSINMRVSLPPKPVTPTTTQTQQEDTHYQVTTNNQQQSPSVQQEHEVVETKTTTTTVYNRTATSLTPNFYETEWLMNRKLLYYAIIGVLLAVIVYVLVRRRR